MIRTLTRIDDRYGLIIDEPIRNLLGIDPETPLEVTAERGGLFIRPASSEADDHRSRVRHSAARMAGIHRDALKKLAE